MLGFIGQAVVQEWNTMKPIPNRAGLYTEELSTLGDERKDVSRDTAVGGEGSNNPRRAVLKISLGRHTWVYPGR